MTLFIEYIQSSSHSINYRDDALGNRTNTNWYTEDGSGALNPTLYTL